MFRSRYSWPRHCWMWVVSFTPRPLYLREKSPLYPSDRRLGGPQDDVGRRIILHIPGFELDPSAVQPVASRYTDCTIQAPISSVIRQIFIGSKTVSFQSCTRKWITNLCPTPLFRKSHGFWDNRIKWTLCVHFRMNTYIFNNHYAVWSPCHTRKTNLMGLCYYLCVFSTSDAWLIGTILHIELQADIAN
jgi:hypothetical protein